ncbi:hypothetical protein B4585_13680 [Lacticaseibacillus paracasei]|nr:hypothetical protein B4585_13680 [Lacticaseibacillus paracasei]
MAFTAAYQVALRHLLSLWPRLFSRSVHAQKNRHLADRLSNKCRAHFLGATIFGVDRQLAYQLLFLYHFYI